MKNIKNFILVYIALRSVFAVFYDVNIAAGLNILELAGFFFPVILILYWATTNFKTVRNNCEKIYIFVVIWVLSATVLKMLSYGFSGIQPFADFFRTLNGFAAFMVFPLIFKDKKSINSLLNAFFIMTLFPLLQGLTQLLIGTHFGAMRSFERTLLSGGEYTAYFGLYYKTGVYASAALFGILIMTYKISSIGTSKKLKIFVYVVFLFLYLILASMTLSRSLAFQLLAIWGIMIIKEITKPVAKTAESFLIISVLILLPLIIYQWDFLRDRYKQLMTRSETELRVLSGEVEVGYAFNARVGLWERKLQEFKKHSFANRLIGTRITPGPHGDFIIWLLEFGYIGFILYLVLFLCLLVSSITTLSRINKMHDTYLRPYGFMVVSGLITWLVLTIAFTPSRYPDYAYFVIGNAAIFLSIGKKMLNQRSSSWASFPLHKA